MHFLRKHWFDAGGVLAIVIAVSLWLNYRHLTSYQLLMWCSLVTLLLHQVEEYKWPGTFSRMINCTIGKSTHPERYPLNTNTALVINVSGWILYMLAAILAEKAVWLGISCTMISLGNIVAHTVVFNIKGKTFYNAGMATALLLFVPVVILFTRELLNHNLASPAELIIGITMGMIFNSLIIKTIFWLANEDSPYIFTKQP